MTTPPRTPLDVDRSKACPLDLDCYCFQGHPGEHMYYSRSAAQLAREAPAPDPASLDVERLTGDPAIDVKMLLDRLALTEAVVEAAQVFNGIANETMTVADKTWPERYDVARHALRAALAAIEGAKE